MGRKEKRQAAAFPKPHKRGVKNREEKEKLTSWLHRHQEKQWCNSSTHWCFPLSIWGLLAQHTSYQLGCQRIPKKKKTL